MKLGRYIAFVAATAATVLNADAATIVASAPYGVMNKELSVGSTGLAFPLIAKNLYTGRIASNTTGALSFSSGNVGALLVAGKRYYIEIVSGPLEGERLDVDTTATISSANATATLDLLTTSASTMNALTAGVLSQARAVLRPHLTVASIGGMITPALVGNATSSLADGVTVYWGSGTIGTYYLRPDGRWTTTPTSSDAANVVVPPDISVLVVNRSGVKKWAHTGAVRTNAFRKNLRVGRQGFATGFPIDLSPVQVGGFIDLQDSAATRWVGAASATYGDTLRVFNDATKASDVFFLHTDGTSWYPSAGGANVATASVLKAGSGMQVQRSKADASYLIVRPFTP